VAGEVEQRARVPDDGVVFAEDPRAPVAAHRLLLGRQRQMRRLRTLTLLFLTARLQPSGRRSWEWRGGKATSQQASV
jgi:hypothetical protein